MLKRFVLPLLFAGLAFGQETSIYPSAIATPAQLGVASNRAATTLLAGINSTATALPVASTSGFKAGSYVTIDSEIFAVCAITDGTHLSVGKSSCPNVDGRGFDTANGGGAAATHLSGASVQAHITAHHINQVAAEVIALETAAVPTLAACVGDGVTNDTACVQAAINATPAGQTLTVNFGKTYCINTVTITSSMTISGMGGFKRCSILSAGFGLFDITATKVTLQGFSIAGALTTPVQINYLASPGAYDAALLTNTSIWIHGGSADIRVEKLWIANTGGDAAFIDARAGNISRVAFIDNRVTDSRSTVFGVPGDYNYGGWTGGFFYANDGISYTINDLLFERNQMLRISGNAIWGHAASLTLQNTNLRILNNYFEDTALDAMQIANVNGGHVAHNHGKRSGYLSITDGLHGSPKYLNASGVSIAPVFLDAAGLVTNVDYDDNSADAINGGWMDGDGYAMGTVRPGTGVSCWNSVDPYASPSSCGAGSNGVNNSYGWNSGNSNNNAGGSFVNILGGVFSGFGAGAVRLYAARNTKVMGLTVYHPNTAMTSPFTYGPTGSGANLRSTGNQISGNTVYWSPTSGSLVAEDAEYSAFLSTDVNTVYDNKCVGTSGVACYQFAKDNNSSGTSGPITFSSVTPQAQGIVESVLQTEGTTGSTYSAKLYANIAGSGTNLWACTLAACTFPVPVNAGNMFGLTTTSPYESPINGNNYAGHMIENRSLGGNGSYGYVALEAITRPGVGAGPGQYVGYTGGVSNALQYFSGLTQPNYSMFATNWYVQQFGSYFPGAVILSEADINVSALGLVGRSYGYSIQGPGTTDFGPAFWVSKNCNPFAQDCGNFQAGVWVHENSYTGIRADTFNDSNPYVITSISNTTPPVVTIATTPQNCYQAYNVVNIAGTTVSAYNKQWPITPLSCTTFSLTGGVASGAATGGTTTRSGVAGLQIMGPSAAEGRTQKGILNITLETDADPTGDAAIELDSTTGTHNFILFPNGSVIIGPNSLIIKNVFFANPSITVGTVAAGGHYNTSITVAGVTAGDFQTACQPVGVLADGLTWNAYATVNTINLRVTNATASPITDATTRTWSCSSIVPGP